jgi:hypothetical protein
VEAPESTQEPYLDFLVLDEEEEEGSPALSDLEAVVVSSLSFFASLFLEKHCLATCPSLPQ